MPSATFLESGSDATQDLTFYSSTTGTVASATDQSKTGPRSIKLSTGSPAATAFATKSGVLADAGRRISFWVYIDTSPVAGVTALLRLTNAALTAIHDLQLQTDMTVLNRPIGATSVSGTTVLLPNTWYRLSVAYVIVNTTTFRFDFYINGIFESSATAGTLTTTGTDTLRLSLGLAAGANVNVWYDDIYVDDGSDYSDPGDVRVTNKRPSANGSANQWTTQIGAGGSGYGSGHSPQVNEQPLSTTNGWSIQNAATQTETYTIEDSATGDVNILSTPLIGVMGWVYTKVASASTGNIIVNGTISNVSVTTSYSLITQLAATTAYPTGTTAIGMNTNAVNQLFSLAECGVLLAYLPKKPHQRIAFDQHVLFAPNFAASASTTAALSSAVSSGQLLTLAATLGSSVASLSTVTDSLSNVWKKAIAQRGAAANTSLATEIWYAANSAPGTPTVTVTLTSTAAGRMQFGLHAWTKASTASSNLFVQAASTQATSSLVGTGGGLFNVSSGSVVLFVGKTLTGIANRTNPANFSTVAPQNSTRENTFYQVQTDDGAVNPIWTIQAATAWSGSLAEFLGSTVFPTGRAPAFAFLSMGVQ